MYEIIAKEITDRLNEFGESISVAGRSAGGGLALHIVYNHGLNAVGLNLACPGYDLRRFQEFYKPTEIPVILCHSIQDQKIPISESDSLYEFLKESNIRYFRSENVPDDKNHITTHRFQEWLLHNLA